MAKVDNFECALCKCKKGRQVFSAFDFDQSVVPFEVTQCLACGVAQTCPMPDPFSLSNYYSETYYGGSTRKFSGIIELLTVLGNRMRAKKILKALSATLSDDDRFKVLDIGCGRANLLRQLSLLGCDCSGTELEEHPAEDAEPDIKIHRGSLEEAQFRDSSFDGVIIWHVLEHLYHPAETLDEIARITRKGGLIALAVPNFSSLQSRLFKSNWFHLDLPRHLYHFNVNNLNETLIQRGYVINSVSTCSLEQNLFGFIQSLMNSFRFLGKPNSFYQLLKQHSGLANNLKLTAWSLLALLIFPIAMIEFGISCILRKGASVIIFAHKSEQQFNKDDG
jgi:SAM-dependent methyltransferase